MKSITFTQLCKNRLRSLLLFQGRLREALFDTTVMGSATSLTMQHDLSLSAVSHFILLTRLAVGNNFIATYRDYNVQSLLRVGGLERPSAFPPAINYSSMSWAGVALNVLIFLTLQRGICTVKSSVGCGPTGDIGL